MNIYSNSALPSITKDNSRSDFENLILDIKCESPSIEMKSLTMDTRLSLTNHIDTPLLIKVTEGYTTHEDNNNLHITKWNMINIPNGGYKIVIHEVEYYELHTRILNLKTVHLREGMYVDTQDILNNINRLLVQSDVNVQFTLVLDNDEEKIEIVNVELNEEKPAYVLSISSELSELMGFETCTHDYGSITHPLEWNRTMMRWDAINKSSKFLHFHTQNMNNLRGYKITQWNKHYFSGYTPPYRGILDGSDLKAILDTGLTFLDAHNDIRLTLNDNESVLDITRRNREIDCLKEVGVGIDASPLGFLLPESFEINLCDAVKTFKPYKLLINGSLIMQLHREGYVPINLRDHIQRGEWSEHYRDMQSGDSLKLDVRNRRSTDPNFIKVMCDQLDVNAGITSHSKLMLACIPFEEKQHFSYIIENPTILHVRNVNMTSLSFKIVDQDGEQLNLLPGTPTIIHTVLHRNIGNMASRIGYFNAGDAESLQYYPSNNNHDFSQTLPVPLNCMYGDHYINLESIFIPARMHNVPGRYTAVQVHDSKNMSSSYIYLPTSYRNEGSFINGMNNIFDSKNIYIKLTKNEDSKKIGLLNTSDYSYTLTFNPQLAFALGVINYITLDGFKVELNPNASVEFRWNSNFSIIQTRLLKVCCDITTESLMGVNHENILRVVNLDITGSDKRIMKRGGYKQYNTPQWVKLQRGTFNRIRFQIRDENNEPVTFDRDNGEYIRGVFTVKSL